MDVPSTNVRVLPSASEVTLYLERMIEPFSHMDLIGAGGLFDAVASGEPIEIEAAYDGDRTIAMPVEPAKGMSPAPGVNHYRFGMHFPVETNVKRLTITLIRGTLKTQLFDGPVESVQPRTEAIPVPKLPWTSPRKYRQLVGRVRTQLLRVRQHVRNRLLSHSVPGRTPHDGYVAHSKPTPRMLKAMTAEWKQFPWKPTISILVPVYNVDPKWLELAVNSVREQVYGNWELCIADDASTNAATRKYVESLVGTDSRIKVALRPTNGHISACSNSAAELATGEFVALLDHDDALAPYALFEIARLLQADPTADLIYSDEDKVDANGRRYDPQFKPSWSPELFLSYNYINHFTCIRKTRFDAVGGFRVGYEGAQDYDLLLRVTEKTNRIRHIPQVLYHWRAVPESTAASARVKEYVHTSARRGLEDSFRRRGISLSVSTPPFADRLGLPILQLDGPTVSKNADNGPRVAIAIWGDKSNAEVTAQAIREQSESLNVTVTVLPTGKSPAQTFNQFVKGTDGKVESFLFIKAGLKPQDGQWLNRLLAYQSMPGVGAVGGLIRHQDGRVISAGTVLGMKDGLGPDSAFCGLAADAISYYFFAESARNIAAVDGRFLLTSRTAFDRVSGFDAEHFGSTLWDVDYGMRLAQAGFRSVHAGCVEVRCDEPVAARADDPGELKLFKTKSGRPVDPYYNPNLSEWETYRPRIDAPLLIPAEAKSPAMKSLVVTHNLNNREGAPRYLSEICIGLKNRGVWQPTMFSPFPWSGETVYDRAGIPTRVTERIERDRFNDGRWERREYERFLTFARGLIREQKPELVLANTLLMFPFVEAAALEGIPSVWIIHESYSEETIASLVSPFAKGRIESCFPLAARVVIASHETADLYERLNRRHNIRVIHNGLDPAPFDEYLARVSQQDAASKISGTPGKKKLLSVGTVCERKGQHTFVEAAGILARERSDFECYLVGAREHVPYARYCRELVRRRNLQGVVHTIAETDDAWSYFRAADAFVFPSHLEAYSLSVLEAEAFGLPIVSTPVFGLNEQVAWGFNALKFPFSDANALADRLRTLLDNDAERKEMGRRSRAMFDTHLDYVEILDRYEPTILAAARSGPRSKQPLASILTTETASRKAA